METSIKAEHFWLNDLFEGQNLVWIDLTCTCCKTQELKLIIDDVSIDFPPFLVQPDAFPLYSSPILLIYE